MDLIYQPSQLIDRSLKNGWITKEEARSKEAKKIALEIAEETTQDWPEDEGFGSSDIFGDLIDFLKQMGKKVEVKGGKIHLVKESALLSFEDFINESLSLLEKQKYTPTNMNPTHSSGTATVWDVDKDKYGDKSYAQDYPKIYKGPGDKLEEWLNKNYPNRVHVSIRGGADSDYEKEQFKKLADSKFSAHYIRVWRSQIGGSGFLNDFLVEPIK